MNRRGSRGRATRSKTPPTRRVRTEDKLASRGAVAIALDRPILVAGTPKAGRSCVSTLLAQAPEFHLLEEPLTIWDIGMGSRPDDRRSADEATPSFAGRIVALCEEAVATAGKRRYLDNLCHHSLRIPFVASVLPEARIILVVRDVPAAVPEMVWGWTYRDTVGQAFRRRRQHLRLASLPRHALRFAKNYISSRLRRRRATWGARVPGESEFGATHSVAELAGYQWTRLNEIAYQDLQQLPRERWILVRFEDLLNDTAATAQRIAAFAQVENPEALVAYAVSHFDANFPYDNKVHPNKEEWATIERLAEPIRRQFGYLA